MGDPLATFLERHVETFNAAVSSGDFSALVALFAPDARLEFEGVPVGPFAGRDEIAAAYAAHPPSDTLTVVDTRVEADGTVVEGFSWSADEGTRAGEMRIVVDDRQILRLVVAFG